MTDKLNEKMCKDFPLLYRDRYGDMHSTCMVWGFPFSVEHPGWFNIIYDLSSKLEPLIQKYLDEHKPTKCANCGCEERKHAPSTEKRYICYNLHYLPYLFQWKWKSLSWPSKAQNWKDCWKIFRNKYVQHYVVEKIKRYISRTINFILDDILHQQFGVTKVKPCWCKQYLLNHPCAVQVKSKFATLRFYMTSETEEMSALIREAEAKSAVTCEECGNVGSLRDDRYWLETLCDSCEVKRKESDTWYDVDDETEKKE